MVASAQARRLYPDAFCQPIRPLSAISWRWRSRWVGALSAVWLGTAVARWHDDGRFGVTLGDAGVDAVLVVSAITRERGHRSRHLVEQGANLGAIIGIMGGQHRGDDLAGVGVHAEMELSPRPPRAGAMLLDQPLAGPAQLQPRAVHQQVHRLSIVPIVRSAARPWAGHLQGGGPAAQGGVVRHREIKAE